MEPSPSHPPERGWHRWAMPLAIALAAVLPYLPGVTSPFTEWDDNYYVTRADKLRDGGLEGFLALWDFLGALIDRQIEFFPLRDSVYWVLFRLFRLNPVPYHVTNIALHVVASLLVRALVLRLGLKPWVAFTAALLFATHPVHVESVTWISALKDPMFLSAMLGSFVLYLRYRESLKPLHYGASLLLLVAALATKSLALATAPMMIFAERLIGKPTPWRLLALRAIGPMGITAISFGYVLAIGSAMGVVKEPHGGSWGNHWMLMSWALIRYVQQAFVPFGFRLHYCFPDPQGLADPRLWATLVLLPAMAGALFLAWRKNRTAAFLILWFFVCLGPVANIVPFPSLMADRYLYSPTVATAVLTAWLLASIKAGRVLVFAMVATYAGAGAARSHQWQKEHQLWDEVAEEPTCWRENSGLALNVLLEWAATQPDAERSLRAFHRVVEHPNIKGITGSLICDRLGLSPLGQRLADPVLELQAAELAARLCGDKAFAWERLAVANWRRRPDISARVMERAYVLEPITFRRWQLGVARLNNGEARGVEDIKAALEAEPKAICHSFREWYGAQDAARKAQVEPLAALCPAP